MNAYTHPNFIFISLFIFIFVLLFAYFFIKAFRQVYYLQLLRGAPQAKVNSCSQGYQALQGKALSYQKNLLISPITNTPCIWYRVLIEESENPCGTLSRPSQWLAVLDDSSEHAFLLQDASGECCVFPSNAKVISAYNKRLNTLQSQNLREKLLQQGYPLHPQFAYRATELILMPDDLVTCLGMFSTHYIKEQVHYHLSANKIGKRPFIISNLPLKKLTNQLRGKSALYFFFSSNALTVALFLCYFLFKI